MDEYTRLPPERVREEYDRLYKPAITPFTHPQLFDPLNPPEGYAYDEWHCVWYKLYTAEESRTAFIGVVAWSIVCLGIAVIVGLMR